MKEMPYSLVARVAGIAAASGWKRELKVNGEDRYRKLLCFSHRNFPGGVCTDRYRGEAPRSEDWWFRVVVRPDRYNAVLEASIADVSKAINCQKKTKYFQHSGFAFLGLKKEGGVRTESESVRGERRGSAGESITSAFLDLIAMNRPIS